MLSHDSSLTPAKSAQRHRNVEESGFLIEGCGISAFTDTLSFKILPEDTTDGYCVDFMSIGSH